MRETDLIATIESLCPTHDDVILGIGDDAAILTPGTRELLVSTDMLMDGRHFQCHLAPPEAIGHKALAVNLSDIAAMGGVARTAFVSLALPDRGLDSQFIERLYKGMAALAQSFGVAIAGGDTNIWTGPFVIAITILGEAHVKGPVRRSTAGEDDLIYVTGPLGGSLSGHHLSFRPRLDEAKRLMDAFTLNSMVDLSDGLAKDLREIARQSGLSAHLDRTALPFRDCIREGPDRWQRALCDGEDFELCFTLSPAEAQRLDQDPRFAFCRRIGGMKAGTGLYWQDDKSPIVWQGYEHGAQP